MSPKKSDRRWTVIFCDSIRQEITGKVTLVGVVSQEVIAEIVPQQMITSVYIDIAPALPAGQDLQVEIHMNGKQIARMDAHTMEAETDRSSTILFEALLLPIAASAELSVHLRLGQEDFGQIGALKITTREDFDRAEQARFTKA